MAMTQCSLIPARPVFPIFVFFLLFGFICCPLGTRYVQAATSETEFSTYGHAVTEARSLLDDGKFDVALATANTAIKMNDRQWEAYAVAALALSGQEKDREAIALVDKAMARAPQSRKATLAAMKNKFEKTAAFKARTGMTRLSPEAKEQLRTLARIASDADRAKRKQERLSRLGEFISRSEEFVREYPDYKDIWVMRGAAALELNAETYGREAGKRLKELGLTQSKDPKVRKVVSLLKKKRWLV